MFFFSDPTPQQRLPHEDSEEAVAPSIQSWPWHNHKDVRAVKSKVKRAMDKNKPEKYVDSPSAKKQKIHEPGGGKKIKIYLYKIYIYVHVVDIQCKNFKNTLKYTFTFVISKYRLSPSASHSV